MNDDRLARALASARPPQRDDAFVLAVLEAAERERFIAQRWRLALRTLGAGTAAAALAPLVAPWLQGYGEALLSGALYAGALIVLVGAVGVLSRQVARRAER